MSDYKSILINFLHYYLVPDGGASDFYSKFRKRHRTSSTSTKNSRKSPTSTPANIPSPSRRESTEIMDRAPSHLDRSFGSQLHRLDSTTEGSVTRYSFFLDNIGKRLCQLL